MGDRVETTCSRCGEEIVVMTAGEYLSSSDADLDFVLHAHERESRIAIRSGGRCLRLPHLRRTRSPAASEHVSCSRRIYQVRTTEV